MMLNQSQCKISTAVALVVLTIGPSRAANLDDEARLYAVNGLSQMWLSDSQDYWIYYSVSQNQFTQILGQNGPIMRFVEARGVTWNVRSKPLTEADRLNGLEWSGTVAMTAEAAREYDCSTGWHPWISRVSLVVASPEKRNGQWGGGYQFSLAVPANTVFQQPLLDELPGLNAGPRNGKICEAVPIPPPPPKQQGCGVRHNPDGTVSGRACY